ncbi:MAG TPA: CAP domain-containing protein [Terriglobales bacterium]
MLLTACLFIGLLGMADPGPGSPDTLIVPPAANVSTEVAQQNLLTLINAERDKAGLKHLTLDSTLSQAALEHAQLMSKQGTLSHQFDGEPDLLGRLSAHAIRVDAASENVVYDVTEQGAHQAFVNSPRHLQNIMNAAYDSIGIGLVNDNGILYVVEDFAHRIATISDDEAAINIAEHVAKLRDQAGLPSLDVVSDPRVQSLVDQMVTRETPDSHAPMALPGVRVAASYATTNPDEIPASVARVASFRGASACAVGVRFARTSRYPSGLFWVTIVMMDQNPTLASK